MATSLYYSEGAGKTYRNGLKLYPRVIHKHVNTRGNREINRLGFSRCNSHETKTEESLHNNARESDSNRLFHKERRATKDSVLSGPAGIVGGCPHAVNIRWWCVRDAYYTVPDPGAQGKIRRPGTKSSTGSRLVWLNGSLFFPTLLRYIRYGNRR